MIRIHPAMAKVGLIETGLCGSTGPLRLEYVLGLGRDTGIDIRSRYVFNGI